jgi:photosystem II oxygen-evolving enhancer protein 2
VVCAAVLLLHLCVAAAAAVVVLVCPGKFYTLTTGANEKRWGKMKDKLATTIKSFSLVNA